jgi:Flp pilus assembly protein TadG
MLRIPLKHTTGAVRGFLRGYGGNITIMTAVLLPIILGMMALSIDYGVWLYQKRKLQTTADATAMGAAQAIKKQTTNQTYAFASTDAAMNGFVVGGGKTLTVNYPPLSGPSAGQSDAAEVIMTEPTTSYFSTLFLPQTPTIQVRAVGKCVYSNSCVITLGSSSGLTLNGAGIVNSPNCGTYVNSSTSPAIKLNGGASLTASSVRAVGSISGSNITAPQGIISGVTPADDPYANLTMPTPGSCTYTNFSSNSTQTLNPGTFCGGMDLNAHANITLNPGTYIINGGSFKVNGQATLSGTGVTIVLTGTTGNYAKVTINGGAAVNLSAPTSGTYKSILFFGDRNATGVNHRFNGGSTNIFSGIFYTPASDVTFAGNAVSGGQACTQIISNSLTVSGTSYLGSGCTASQVTQVGILALSE